MRRFNVGDIVKMKYNDDEMYIIVDFLDFSQNINGKAVEDIDYEIMRIIPVYRKSKYSTVSQNDLVAHLEYGSKGYEVLMKYIEKQRENKNWFEEPDFLQILKVNLEQHSKNKDIDSDYNIIPVKLDEIKYDMCKTIDECLDRIIDLDMLLDMGILERKEYTKHKHKVIKRLEKLTKK